MAELTQKDTQGTGDVIASPKPSSSTATEALSQLQIKDPAEYTAGEAPEYTLEDPNRDDSTTWLGLTDESFVPLQLSPKWIDLDTIRGWIRTCINDHGPECWPLEMLSGLPVWLIDVKEQCLIPATAQHTYLALSYVWGQAESSETTKLNIVAFQTPGAFSPANRDVEIPKTIRHAMGLVDLLGERYLWVDRLCICQDDEETKASQIDIMGDIYGNALVTIIAASGWDANHGLRGIKGVTEPRDLAPNAGDDYFKSIEPQSSFWYSRGWTFQELFFSRRKLMFHYQTAIWECSCALRHEIHGSQNVGLLPATVKVNPGGFERLLNPGQLSFVGETGLRLWFSMINQYNVRDLTYPEDVSRAFAGVVNAFTKVAIPGGFFWGLPIDRFDASLLWIASEPLKRRLPKDTESEAPPSWSWMGWQGRISNDAWMDLQSQNDYPNSWRTTLEVLSPECEWLYVESVPNETPSYPRPIHQGSQALRPRPYLITHAEIATFKINDNPMSFNDSAADGNHMTVRTRILTDAGGKFCGALMGESELQVHEDGLEVECLAISSSTNKLMGGGTWEGSVWNSKNYYNVLWVNRADDAFTRQGIGRILKSAWDAHEEKSFEIVKLA
ncbi:HET-domain-containing protein [Acephala macrosclerotiorum]|nr:HET-domain-containing protein [Acephala macrosclerotiorum]